MAIARPDHWFKNIFILPGGALALILVHDPVPGSFGGLLLALVSTCLIASANYTIDEWLDTEFDRHHPVKKFRPAAAGQITAPVAYALRKLGAKRRANYAKPVARLAVFAYIVEHRESHQTPREALGRASRPR